MNLGIGFITGIGIIIGIKTYHISKKRGIIQLILALLAPLLIFWWCKKKPNFVFGGTNWEFLIQTAFIDLMFEPWVILLIYIFLISSIIYNIIKLRKIKGGER